MTEVLIKEVDKLTCRESCHHHFDPEDPQSEAQNSSNNNPSCLEERRQQVQSQKGKRYFGKHIPLLWRNDEPFLTLGPHWPLFLLTWCSLLSIGIFVIYHIPGTSSYFKLSAVVITIWQAFIYLLTALKNPGIVTAKDMNDPRKKEHVIDQSNFCRTCKIATNKNILHCNACKVCIRGYHHHCPWTGKCIGAGNGCYFYVFLISTGLYILFCIVAAAMRIN